MKFFALLVVLFATLCLASAQCNPRPNDWSNHFCKLSAVADEGIFFSAIGVCDITNTENPFIEISEQCFQLLKDDGNECVYAATKFECSYDCMTCADIDLFKPCYDVCSSMIEQCPKAIEANCFPNLLNQKCAAEGSSQCTSIGIDKDKVKEFAGDNGGGNDNGADGLSRSATLIAFAVVALLVLIQ